MKLAVGNIFSSRLSMTQPENTYEVISVKDVTERTKTGKLKLRSRIFKIQHLNNEKNDFTFEIVETELEKLIRSGVWRVV